MFGGKHSPNACSTARIPPQCFGTKPSRLSRVCESRKQPQHVFQKFQTNAFCLFLLLRTTSFFRDTGMEGWKGGDDGTKVMVFEVDMPHCGTDGFTECIWDRPAVWALNSKVSYS